MDRAELYRKFGPMQMEARDLVLTDEINLIRADLGLSKRTNQQIVDAISNKLAGVEKYDWMKKERLEVW